MDPLLAADSKCPLCGALLPADAVSGCCPRCLMAGAMQPTQAGDQAAPIPTLTPEELAPHFPQLEIMECLGRGGMGVVYKARQKSLNRLVALKLLAPERADDPQFAARFEKEAHALAALNHPNIVGVYDFGSVVQSSTLSSDQPRGLNHIYYLLMEFVDGVNLRQLLQTKRLTPKEALSIVPPVCDALQCAHDHGVVHRDIKPENLLIDKAGTVKIADFGIAKMLGTDGARLWSETQPQHAGESGLSAVPLSQPTLASIAGTPQYMAPEQKTNGVTDHRADIYSLGVVFYEMLTGELPAQQLEVPSRKVQLDVRIDEIVLRALERTPELRYQTAGEFRTQVEVITSGPAVPQVPLDAGTTAQRTGAVGVVPPPRFSRLAIIGAAWVGLFLLALFLFFMLHVAHEVPPGEPVPSGPELGVWLMMTVMFIGFAAPLGTTILGWVAFVQIRRSAGRLWGKGLALFDGLLFPVLAVGALALYQANKVSHARAAHDREIALAKAEEAGIRQVRFQFNHPDAIDGGHTITMREKVGRETGWMPSTGQGLSLKNGKTVNFRCRMDSSNPGSVGAWVQASLPDGNWETLQAVFGAESLPESLDFTNGLHVVVSLLDNTPDQTTPAQKTQAASNPPINVLETNQQLGTSPLIYIVSILRLLIPLGFLYLVYRVWRRYGGKTALMLIVAVVVLLLLTTIKSSRTDRASQPVVSKLEIVPTPTPTGFELVLEGTVSPTFGPLIEKTLSANESLAQAFLDLDTGTILSAPQEIAAQLAQGKLSTGPHDPIIRAWMRSSGADLVLQAINPPMLVQADGRVGLWTLPNGKPTISFESVTPAEVESSIGNYQPVTADPSSENVFHCDPSSWSTFVTREGAKGILEITQIEGRSVKLRYKLAQDAAKPVTSTPATFESVTDAARKLIARYFPDAVISAELDEFIAQAATQEFEIHTQFKTGEVAQNAQKQSGPSATGFMLTVRRLKAPLVSAAADLPQSFDRPYWKSYVNSGFDPRTGQGVAVYFDFGARLDPDFKKAMLELLQLRHAAVQHPPQHADIPEDPNSPAHLPPDIAEHIKAKRNEKLAMTDERMREFITQLAEKFPALRRTDKGTLVRSLTGKSEKGTLQIDFRFPPLTTEGPPNDAPPEATHRVTVVLRPLTPGQAGPYGLTRYGRLGLYGDVIVSAGDSALQTALTKLVREELSPLAELDGTAVPKELGDDYANFATLDDAAKEKLVWNLSDAGSIFRPEHKGICRDLLATQGRYTNANAPSFTSTAIAVAVQQDWREMRGLVAQIYHRPTNSFLYGDAFRAVRKWDRIPIPAEIVSAAETLHEAGTYQTTVKDADMAEATALLLAAQDKEAVLVQTIVQALRNPGKGSTKRGWDALVQVLTHLNAMTVRETLRALREEAATEISAVKTLEADYMAALALGPWGEAVDGVQASLRAEREEWWKSELPAFKLKVRNQGEHSPFVARQQEVAEVEFGGQWYVYSGPVDVLSGPIQPDEYFDNIAVALDPKLWHSKETHEPLALKPGWHTVRVSMGLEVTPSVRIISNPIKINLRETHEPLPLAPPPPIPSATLEQAKAAQVDVIFQDKNTDGTPYRRLTFHSGPYVGPGSEPWDTAAVTPEQLARVLDHLAQTRFFDTVKEYDSLEVAKRQPCYILKVRQHGHEFYENLGWGRQTGERLEKLRSVLEGDANAAMSKLLAALAPKLREWEDASWSAIQNGLQLRVETERPIFKVGDNVILRFTFRNTTDRPFTVLDAQDQMRGTFHQFTFTDEKGEDIAQTSTPDPAWENKGIGEIMVRHEIPAHGMISRTVSLSGWNLAGLGHPYTGIGKEARSFNVTGAYFTRVGLDLKDPKVWLGHIAAKPVRIEIVENHPPISAASQTADSSPAALAAASGRGKASAAADIKAGRLRILHSGMPWSQGKPLFDDTTGYRVEPLGGCAETPQFRTELDAYNQTMRDWHAKSPLQITPKN